MKLPYENASSGSKAMEEIQKILKSFGCSSFGNMTDFNEEKLIVQFKYKETPITVEASFRGYANAWLKHNPYTSKKHCSKQEWEQKALEIGGVAVYSILRDWIKGQITAIECGILSFENAFLGQIMLPSGQTIFKKIQDQKLIPNMENNNG